MFVLLMLFSILGCAASDSMVREHSDRYSLTIRLPNVTPKQRDALLCSAIKLDPEEAYIEKFIPHSSEKVAHHMMLYGCPELANDNPSWLCDKPENYRGGDDQVCRGAERQIIFAWALDAKAKSMPKDAGFRVSGNTSIKYLVVQVHYAKAFPPGQTDNSGYTLELTHKRPPKQVGYLVLGNWGSIPPQTPAFNMDASCKFPLSFTIYPFAFRTHSHNLGVVTSGYRIRNGKWDEIGRMSPQLPQAFYNIHDPNMNIKPGDELASKCIMNSMTRNSTTIIGPTNHDEMCNFYIMFSTYYQGLLQDTMCFQNANSGGTTMHFPANAGSLDGIPGADKVKKKFNIL